MVEEYDMVTTDDEGALLSLVNMALREGWTLQGGLTMAYVPREVARGHEGYTLYGQALVREREEEPPPCSH